jgi:hypothetical protein
LTAIRSPALPDVGLSRLTDVDEHPFSPPMRLPGNAISEPAALQPEYVICRSSASTAQSKNKSKTGGK